MPSLAQAGKDLIDYCGKGGGYILTTGTQIL
jgi:hypothetical protein